MKKHIIILLASVLVLCSCGTSKFFAGDAASIQPIALIEPYSYITDAVMYFSTEYQKDVSVMNQTLVKEAVNSLYLPVQTIVPYEFNPADNTLPITRWMRSLSSMGSETASRLSVPVELRDAVTETGCRYGMVLMDVGFVKNADQYTLESVVSGALTILDYLLNDEVSVSYTQSHENGLYSLIWDNQTGRVVWYGNRTKSNHVHPLKHPDILKQIEKLYDDFL